MSKKVFAIICLALFALRAGAQKLPDNKLTAGKNYEVAVYYFPNYHPDSINTRWHGKGWTEAYRLIATCIIILTGISMDSLPFRLKSLLLLQRNTGKSSLLNIPMFCIPQMFQWVGMPAPVVCKATSLNWVFIPGRRFLWGTHQHHFRNSCRRQNHSWISTTRSTKYWC
jgi:hypothetical protein